MILRRLSTAFRNQDWFTVVIETLIVVLGVFLGLQLGNWNEGRSERQLGADYAARLVVDLEKDLLSQQTVSDYYGQVLTNIETADRLLASDDPDPVELVAAAYRGSEFSADPINEATWEQVVSSGHLGLLPGDAIASGLSDYYKFQDANNETISLLQGSPYRLAVRSLIPLTVQLAIREGCSDETNEAFVVQGFVAECRIDVDDALLAETAQALVSSPLIRESLRHQYSMVASARNNTNGNLALIEGLLAELRASGDAP